MMRFGIKYLILGLCALASLCSCEYRKLYDPSEGHYVRIYIDENIPNLTTDFYSSDRQHPSFERPTIMKVMLCDPESGNIRSERYLRNIDSDERGYYIDGYVICPPGQYTLVAYNFGTEATIIKNADKPFISRAYTNPLSVRPSSLISPKSLSNTIVNIPDHLFVVAQEIDIPYTSQLDTLQNPNIGKPYFCASSIVETYYIQIGVKGAQYLSAISATITGMSDGKTLLTAQLGEESVGLHFNMLYTNPGEDEGLLYASFNTFGKIPSEESELILNFDMLTSGGQLISTSIDISEYFLTSQAINHRWLIINKTLDIPAPQNQGSSGFNPGVTEWEDVYTDIII